METEERYEIRGKIGEGGRGAVYHAFDRQLNRNVAIKRLLAKGVKEGEDAYEAIIKESHALSAISSPHIVRVFDFEHDVDGPYVVMEFLEGKTLHDVVVHAPLIESDFLTVAQQALEALIAAHEAKLLHRDIKPSNLMLTWLPSGRIQLKLLDFGLAKFTEKPAVQTIGHDSSVLGSIYFMAPEQFDRSPLDARTDLYSLGCVLFFALTGQYPFLGDSATEVMASHLQGIHTELKALRPDLSPALCNWTERLLARDPEARPANAQMALDTLEELRRELAANPATKRSGNTTVQLPAGGRAPTPAPTQAVPTAIPTAPQPTLPTATVPIMPAGTGTAPVQTITTSTVLVAAPKSLGSLRKSTRVPAWVYVTSAILGGLIVLLGIAALMRGNPANTIPPPNPGENPNEQAGPPGTPDKRTPLTLPPNKPPNKPPSLTELFKQRDKNGDLKISRAEFVGPPKHPKAKEKEAQFRKLDTDKNGFLSKREFNEIRPAKKSPAEKKSAEKKPA